MGDRAYTSITINKYYYDQLKHEFGGEKKLEEEVCVERIELEDDSAEFVDGDANYGMMERLENILQERKIEYNKRWENGGDYGAGEEYARNVNGEYKTHNIYDVGGEVLTALKELKELKDPELRDLLLTSKIKDLEPFEVTPLLQPQSIDFIKKD